MKRRTARTSPRHALVSTILLAAFAGACGGGGEAAPPENFCGGRAILTHQGVQALPGDACGDEMEGLLVCDGPDVLRCDDGTAPAGWLASLNPENVAARGATFRGMIAEFPAAGVADHGFCWSTDAEAAAPTCHGLGAATASGSFSHRVENLDPGRKYYVRAYAVVETERAFANEISFSTLAPGTTFEATQGTFEDRVVLTWEPVEGAIGYGIIRDQEELFVAEGSAFRFEDEEADAAPVPAAPLQFIASEGDHTAHVRLSWQESPTEVARHAYRVDVIYPDARSEAGQETWGYRAAAVIEGYTLEIDGEEHPLGVVTSYEDDTALAGELLPATVEATGGGHDDRVVASLTEAARHVPAVVSYRLRALGTNGAGPWTPLVEGYRGAGELSYQWERSSADAAADYGAIDGAVEEDFVDRNAPDDGSGRYYRVVAHAEGFDAVVSDGARGFVARLQAATDVLCATGQAGTFTLSFGAAAGNVALTGYRVYGANTAEELATAETPLVELAPEAVNTALNPGLDGPVFYGLRALAAGADGEPILGPVSDAAGCAPTEPSGLTGEAAEAAVVLTWTADAMPQVTAYQVHYGRAGVMNTLSRRDTTCTAGATCTITIDGLEPLATYVFYVVAVNAAGSSVASLLDAAATVEVYVPALPASSEHTSIEGDDGIADGTTPAEVRIFLANRNGEPVVGEVPSFEATGQGNLYGPCSPTNAAGMSTCTLRSSVGETKTLRITAPIVVEGGSVHFEQGCNREGEPFGGGRGTAEQPYALCSVAQLNRIDAQGLTRHFVLYDDLDLTELAGEDFHVIGKTVRFSGRFDGAGHRISNLVIDEPQTTACGFFGYLSGEVVDLVLDGVDITCADSVGGLAGVTLDATIEDVTVSGWIEAIGDNVGGLVGIAAEGTIVNVGADVIVVGTRNVGGLIGEMYDQARVDGARVTGAVEGEATLGGLVGLMRQDAVVGASHAAVDVVGTSLAVGGLVGSLTGNSIVHDASASGSVDGQVGVGGLAGRVLQGTIRRSAAYGAVRSSVTAGNSDTGGLVGFITGGLIEDCHARGVVTGYRRPAGLVGTLDGATVRRAHAVGKVDGTLTPGGLIGLAFPGATVEHSYWNTETTQQSESDGGEGLTTDTMGLTSSFSGWIFAPAVDYVWMMPAGGPPLLWFEE